MQYRCPKCQSVKIMPVGQAGHTARPDIPKSLIILLPSIFILLLLTIISISFWIFSNGVGTNLQIATVIFFVITTVAGLLFWRDFPNFKLSMQAFMQSQKHWKCRDCNHDWEI